MPVTGGDTGFLDPLDLFWGLGGGERGREKKEDPSEEGEGGKEEGDKKEWREGKKRDLRAHNNKLHMSAA